MDEARPDWIYPYGDSDRRFHLQHVHLFASNLDASISFYEYWFDAKVIYDGETAGARNVFMKIGVGALHFYDQPPKAGVRMLCIILACRWWGLTNFTIE